MLKFILFYFTAQFIALGFLLFSHKRKTPHLDYCKSLAWILDVKLIQETPISNIKSTAPIIYLCNHRDWGDFIVDSIITNDATFLSRMMVLPATLFSSLLALLYSRVLFFNKSSIKRPVLYNRIKNQLTQNNVVIYPEGTRNLSSKSKPLRYGIIKFAYVNLTPVQIIITTNKEHILSQKLFTVNCGINCHVRRSKILDPKNYSSVEEWIAHIDSEWYQIWSQSYTNDTNSAISINKPPMLRGLLHFIIFGILFSGKLGYNRLVLGKMCSYGASSFYHNYNFTNEIVKNRWLLVDHLMIYVSILASLHTINIADYVVFVAACINLTYFKSVFYHVIFSTLQTCLGFYNLMDGSIEWQYMCTCYIIALGFFLKKNIQCNKFFGFHEFFHIFVLLGDFFVYTLHNNSLTIKK